MKMYSVTGGMYYESNSANDKFNLNFAPAIRKMGVKEENIAKIAEMFHQMYEVGHSDGYDVGYDEGYDDARGDYK